MGKIFRLKSNVSDFPSFIESYPASQESIIGRAIGREWYPFDEGYQPITLKLRPSDDGKRNYTFDVSGALGPFFVFSEKAVATLSDVLDGHGQLLPVLTESKRKKFVGYYPTGPAENCLDMKLSKYRQYENGLVIDVPILIKANLPDRDIFVINEDISRVFVTEQFKEKVEGCGLVAFDFSTEVKLV